jgi:hypothetical protein
MESAQTIDIAPLSDVDAASLSLEYYAETTVGNPVVLATAAINQMDGIYRWSHSVA